MTKTTKIILGLIIAIIVIGGIWYGVGRKPAEEGVIKIGVSAPLTGEVAIWGQSALAAIELATQEINASGGINGVKVELIIEDDKASPQDSANAANKLINIDKVTAILFASGSGATSPAVPIAQNNGIPAIVTIASAPLITKTGDYIFRTTPSDSLQGKFAADFIFNKLDKKNVAILYTESAWGQGVKDEFKKEFLALNGEIAYESGILTTDTDLRGELLKVKNSGAKVLYFPAYPTNALSGFKQIKELGINLPVVCGDAIDGNEVLQNPAAEGIIYTLAKINSPIEFVNKINSIKGFETLKPNIAAPTSYDGAKILFEAIRKAGTDKVKIREELVRTNYAGVSNPIIEFDENREIKNPVFEVKIVKNKEAVLYPTN